MKGREAGGAQQHRDGHEGSGRAELDGVLGLEIVEDLPCWGAAGHASRQKRNVKGQDIRFSRIPLAGSLETPWRETGTHP